MRLATGVDLIDIERFRQAIDRHGDRFLRRVFTEQELADVGRNIASLAVRFAAKEAVAKALGTGIGAVAWQEIEVLHGQSREPVLYLHGQARLLAEQLGLATWSLSLSHAQTHAIAMVVAFSM